MFWAIALLLSRLTATYCTPEIFVSTLMFGSLGFGSAQEAIYVPPVALGLSMSEPELIQL